MRGRQGRWVYPCDPECPEYGGYMEALFNDPITIASGCGGEIAADFESKHRAKCTRCQEYGAANIDIEY